MKTLQQLALAAVSEPSFQAQMHLPDWHPIAVQLQDKDNAEKRKMYQKEHSIPFHTIRNQIERSLPSSKKQDPLDRLTESTKD